MTSRHNDAMFTLARTTQTWGATDEVFGWSLPPDLRARMLDLADLPREERLSAGCRVLESLLWAAPQSVHLALWLMCNARVTPEERKAHKYPGVFRSAHLTGKKIVVEMSAGGYVLRGKHKWGEESPKAAESPIDVAAVSMR